MAAVSALQVVAETHAFSEDADALLSRDERDAVITAIAHDPTGGDVVAGTGGLRKRRIALPGRGKRGGARVITLYLGPSFPVYALFMYAKNERADLSADQKRSLMRIVAGIKLRARGTR